MFTIDLDLNDASEGASVRKPFLGAWIDGVPYMVIEYVGMRWLVSGICPHRGGPLHLGEEHGEYVTCPWHKSSFRKHKLINSALPFIRSGNRIRILAKEPAYNVSALTQSTIYCAHRSPVRQSITSGRPVYNMEALVI